MKKVRLSDVKPYCSPKGISKCIHSKGYKAKMKTGITKISGWELSYFPPWWWFLEWAYEGLTYRKKSVYSPLDGEIYY